MLIETFELFFEDIPRWFGWIKEKIQDWRKGRRENKIKNDPTRKLIFSYLDEHHTRLQDLERKNQILAAEIVNLGNSVNNLSYRLSAKMGEIDEARTQLAGVLIENQYLKENKSHLEQALKEERFDLDV